MHNSQIQVDTLINKTLENRETIYKFFEQELNKLQIKRGLNVV